MMYLKLSIGTNAQYDSSILLTPVGPSPYHETSHNAHNLCINEKECPFHMFSFQKNIEM